MEYLKISELANKCEVKRQQISEYYRMIGANPNFTIEIKDAIHKSIDDMQDDLNKLENKLRKLIN
jgi:predicted DNA-binding protein YlxM (UPF0122 family)